jgi:hypothetical protein
MSKNQTRNFGVCTLLLCSSQVALIAPAFGQSGDRLGDSVLSREASRLREGGIRAGAFTILPTVDAEVSYNDNIRANSSDTASDGIVTVRPQVEVESDWNLHQIRLLGTFQRVAYLENTSEDASEYTLVASGRIDVSRDTRLRLDADFVRQAERRGDLGSIQSSAERAKFSTIGGRVRLDQRVGNLALGAEGRIRQWTYDDVLLANGQNLDQSFRNFDLASGSLQAGYYISPFTQVFSRFTYEARRYALRRGDAGFDPLTGIDRSANSTRFEVGIQRELNELVTATVRIGYLNFRYPDPAVKDVKAFAYFATVRWNPTPLTTVTLDSERSIDETVSPSTAGNLRDELRLSVDHELLRQMIISLRGRLAWINPAEATATVAIGNIREREFSIEPRYYLTNRLRLTFNARHVARNSSSNRAQGFTANSATLGLRYAF